MQKFKTIDEFLHGQDAVHRDQINILRKLILSTEPSLLEHIKWNAPSYVFNGEDRITFNVMNKRRVVILVFHMGASRKENKGGSPVLQDDSGLMEWNSDIRAMITFNDAVDITRKSAALETIIKAWLSIPAKV